MVRHQLLLFATVPQSHSISGICGVPGLKRGCVCTVHKDKNCNFPWMTAHGVSAKVLRSQLRLWLNRSSAGRARERPRLRWNRKEQAAYRRASAVALRPAHADEDDDTPSWMRTDDRGGAATLHTYLEGVT